ncbi:MAG: hypothetical protein GY768_12460 [Planctomycetaceae bacterium]|nr:hypothetical protein [Planctomycetaceae bacterium]
MAFIAVNSAFCVLIGTILIPIASEEQSTAQAGSSEKVKPSEPVAALVGHPTFVSPHATPIAHHNDHVFVVNTPADTVDVIKASTRAIVARVKVGIDPVSIAIRPDGKEVWVSNHVSDSISVIDSDPTNPTYLEVVATIQDLDSKTKATRFDEPVGIAFASDAKAYVALSSENVIAVINTETRKVTKRLNITAQDPRAIRVQGNRLYVTPFESNNQTQLSGGTGDLDGDRVTFNAHQHSIAVNNVLSLGHVVDIVKHPEVPDRDLYIFDTETDKLVEVVDTLGTLLYGLAVDSTGNVYIAQTDARNEVNGRAGTQGHGLAELENRAFLNQITSVAFKDDVAQPAKFINLEPLPPSQPDSGEALATPFAIEVSADDSTLIVSAAGSDKLFTVDTATGQLLGRTDVGAVPRGIALENSPQGKPVKAWVLNAVANTVSLVDLSNRTQPEVLDTISLQDPTHPTLKQGRIAFNTASASTTGTFSCASCHPDGHTDQLLWVLKTPVVSGGNQIMPRSTMPVRGLRDTAPFHWDGIPGDPYGGNNSANIHTSVEPNSNLDIPESSTRHLIDGGIAATMSLVGDTTVNDEGKAGALTAAERDAMSIFLLNVPYPPAQRRAYTNVLSSRAKRGFRLFHIEGDHQGQPEANVCGDCHRMPFWVSTNTPGTGMDAPTWRGAYDRFLILPQGRLNIIDFDFYREIAKRGIPERNMWQFSWAGRRRFDPVWDMVLEGSTGYSGAFARQVTIDRNNYQQELTTDLLKALERSAAEGAVVLTVDGMFLNKTESRRATLRFDARSNKPGYVERNGQGDLLAREDLLQLASTGKFVGTFTARHGANADLEHPQPAIWTLGPIEQQSGRQQFPILYPGHPRMIVSARHVRKGAHLIVDGRRVAAKLKIEGETLEIEPANLPTSGMHLLQVQNPNGMFSNDFIFHVTNNQKDAALANRKLNQVQTAINTAVSRGDARQVRQLLNAGVDLNVRHPNEGSTALSTAALHGQLEIVKLLLERGSDPNATNNDGNTPLHVAAFFCHDDIVELLIDRGASIEQKNNRGETAVDTVSPPWSDELAGFYRVIAGAVRIELNLQRIEKSRPLIAETLHQHAANTASERDSTREP